jgi:ferredoxin/coenzyme F420-reducing hydrogenase delta subunit
LRRFENGWLYLDGLLHQFISPALNPLGQLGAIANTSFLIAVVSGILLLFWYVPSVHEAYASLEKVGASSWLGQLMRSLHRYSSDGCLFFVLLHALRIAGQRRITGPRWLAWTTGLLMLALLWFIGWTGYWLVWDVRGQHAALGTARFVDRLPIFAEPLSRSFLIDGSVPSLLFFLIFFVHMLAPLAIGVGLWMHLMRVSRPRFLTGRTMTYWVLGSLVVISVLFPATSAGPAQMTVKAQQFTLDWWYLWPTWLTDRLSGGLLWGIFLLTGLIGLTAPWWLAKRRLAPAWQAHVEASRCMGCTLCSKDCPFDAVTMVAREDGRKSAVLARVDPARCVGCGVCAGACDSQAINLPALNSRVIEKQIRAWIKLQLAEGERPFIGFCCQESAAASSLTKPVGASLALPGFLVVNVPCAGWVSAVMLERALSHGAEGVLVVGCGEGDLTTREGLKWFRHRLTGEREPKLAPQAAASGRIRFVTLDRTARGEFLDVAREFQEQTGRRIEPRSSKPALRVAAALATAVALAGVIVLLSDVSYRTPHSTQPELVVSFNHRGELVEPRKLTAKELAKRLPHMRAQVSVTRTRVPVRLRVHLDGRVVHEQAYQPKGLSKDGSSIALTRLPVTPGEHSVRVEIGDTADASQWPRQWSETLQFSEGRVRVVLFDGKNGFSVH